MKKTKGGILHYIQKYGHLSKTASTDSEFDDFLDAAFQPPKKGAWLRWFNKQTNEWGDYEFDGKEWQLKD